MWRSEEGLREEWELRGAKKKRKVA